MLRSLVPHSKQYNALYEINQNGISKIGTAKMNCLQWKMNIYFSYLLCLLFIFVHYQQKMQKKVMQVLFCDLHSAVVLADIVQSSRRKYRPCVIVHRFCRATKPRPQKSADFVNRSTSA